MLKIVMNFLYYIIMTISLKKWPFADGALKNVLVFAEIRVY